MRPIVLGTVLLLKQFSVPPSKLVFIGFQTDQWPQELVRVVRERGWRLVAALPDTVHNHVALNSYPVCPSLIIGLFMLHVPETKPETGPFCELRIPSGAAGLG